jgi:hypothetical protein
MAKRKDYSGAFQKALNFIFERGYTYRYVAQFLTKASEPFQGRSVHVDHAAVFRWHTENRIPHSEAVILMVITWADYLDRMDCLFKELHSAMDEFEVKLPDAIDYLKGKGYSWQAISDFAEGTDIRTVRSWGKGHKPKPSKQLLGMKLNQEIPNERASRIKGRSARERGSSDRAFYKIYHVFVRYRDLIPGDEHNKKTWEEITEWVREHEGQEEA